MLIFYRRLYYYYKQHMTRGDGNCWVLYGNPAYPIRPQILRPFQGALLTPEQSTFNSQMSSVCVCVLNGDFGMITTLWEFVDFKKNTKILLQPVAKYYAVAANLTNCHACFLGTTLPHTLGCIHRHLQSTCSSLLSCYFYLLTLFCCDCVFL